MSEFIEKAVLSMANKRQIFHSEDDLKFALASCLKDHDENLDIRLEKPEHIPMVHHLEKKTCETKVYVDMVVYKDTEYIPVELKYKTKHCEVTNSVCGREEVYELTNQNAQDQGKYQVRKDIYRVEQLIEKYNSSTGYVLFITNDKKYMEDTSIKSTQDANFSMHNQYSIPKGNVNWNLNIDWDDAEQIPNSFKGEYGYKLILGNNYIVNWKEYSEIGEHTFWYCLFKVTNNRTQ